MKKSQLKKMIKEEINFALGSTIHGDPDKPMDQDFTIVFKNPMQAEMMLDKISEELQAEGLNPLEYENLGVVFKTPSNQQMSRVLKTFNNSDIESMGRL